MGMEPSGAGLWGGRERLQLHKQRSRLEGNGEYTSTFQVFSTGDVSALCQPEFSDLSIGAVRALVEAVIVLMLFIDSRESVLTDGTTEDKVDRLWP